MKLRRKGFSLVEMLVVIAIVAVLVAIIIPVVGTSTTKAAAATNAANLRAMEGKLNTMYVQNPGDFKTLFDQVINELNVQKNDGSVIGTWLHNQAVKLFATVKADSNGVLTLRFTPSAVTIENVPAAKSMTAKGTSNATTIHVSEGTPMSVVIADNRIKAYYGNYSLDDFAQVADNGKWGGFNNGDGNGSGTGSWLPDIPQTPEDWACAMGKHDYDDEGYCKNCGQPDQDHCIHIDEGRTVFGVFVSIPDEMCDDCGAHMPHEHKDEKPSDFKCDICGEFMDHLHTDTNPANHKCDICSEEVSKCKDDSPKDHLCDICNKQITFCDDFRDVHKCTICQDVSDCVDNDDHNCDICGTNISTCKDEKPKDHKCDICGAGRSVCVDDAPRDHKCDICGAGNQGGDCVAPAKKHNCGYCNAKKSDCNSSGSNAEGHYCTICETPKGSHSASRNSDTCSQSGCGYRKEKRECGCTEGKTFIAWAATCENATCGHRHKSGEPCTEKVETGNWVK